eukprot:CAMPEP_0197011854 /NCGR_PEP_ID=MMETSP1380-20130617/60296_1 /TAXON_ID=5936 /ORGANISM="Euplotes crassus, Strain CT5" /LENGTH=168 /DNA_ID=CAMNT_0042434917 /DNA_START=37 /DNA_END=543 /DNA_ORIENTATION=-
MLIFKDAISSSKDELLSDVYQYTEVEDIVWEVEAKMVQVSDDVNVDIGANASAEEENEEYAANVRTVNNIVDSFRLQETSFDKKSYMTYIKGYMKNMATYLEKKNPERVADFQKAAQNYVKKILSNISEYQFFTGESMDPDGMVVLCIWRGETPVMIYFKDGFEEMKV